MFEKVSEPSRFSAKLACIGFKNRGLEGGWDPNAPEGRLFEEDNVRRGAEEFCPRTEGPTLILSRRRRDVQAHPQRPTQKGQDRIVPLLLQRTGPAALSLFCDVKGGGRYFLQVQHHPRRT